MRRCDVEVALFFNPANIRYATGTTVMTVYAAGAFVRCALVPAEGEPILFEHAPSMHLSSRIVRDVRPFHAFEFAGLGTDREATTWSRQILDGIRDLGVGGHHLAVDRLATPAFLALQREGIEPVDSGPFTLEAREVKTPEEIELFRAGGAVGMAMLEAFERSLRPGVRENELLAVLTDTLLRQGGEHLITRACVSGPNTNPWNLEAGDRAVEDGDVVFVDTDAHCIEGYFIDVSRTFLCGERSPTRAEREAYRAAHDQVTAMAELARPGTSFEEFARRAPALPAKYRAQRYEVMVHSAGLEDEGPSIPYPDDPAQPMPDKQIAEGMVLCLESYVGEVGASFGIKLEDQVLVTPGGPELLVPYPYASAFLD